MKKKSTLCPNTNCLSTTYKKKTKGNLKDKEMYKTKKIVTCSACGLDHEETKRPTLSIALWEKRAMDRQKPALRK